MLNILDTLKKYKIPFKERHSSISHKCIAGVCCPFCQDDNNYHVGIFPPFGNFSCWKCGKKGSLYVLVKRITGVSYDEYRKISGIIERGDSVMNELNRIFNQSENEGEPLPPNEKASTFMKIESDGMPLSIHILIDKFLTYRGFDYDILEKYGCMYGMTGFFSQRLVIPLNGSDRFLREPVAFIGRDLTETSVNKYLISPPGVKISNYLYFTSLPTSWNEWIVLVEGIFDAWAVAECGFVGAAMLGSCLSERQLNQLKKFTRKVIYMPDGDISTRKMLETKDSLVNSFAFSEEVFCEYKNDPCSMERKVLKEKLARFKYS